MDQQLLKGGEGQAESWDGWVLGTVMWVAVFLTLDQGFQLLAAWDADHSNPDDGFDFGLGFLLLAGLVVVAALGGVWDGWRGGGSARQLCVRWVLVGLSVGITSTVEADHGEQLTWSEILFDFVGFTLLLGGAVAIAGVVLAVSVRQHRLDLELRRRAGF